MSLAQYYFLPDVRQGLAARISGCGPQRAQVPIELEVKALELDTGTEVLGDIPPQVKAIVERAMAKEPGHRWPSAAALASVARQAKQALSQQARAGGGHPGPVSGGPVSGAPASPAGPRARSAVARIRLRIIFQQSPV